MFSFYDYSREQRARQRYSVEVANAGNYLNIRPSTLETLNKSGQSSIYNRRNRKTNVSILRSLFRRYKKSQYSVPDKLFLHAIK